MQTKQKIEPVQLVENPLTVDIMKPWETQNAEGLVAAH